MKTIVVLIGFAASLGSPQDGLLAARQLYAAAAFDEALAELSRLAEHDALTGDQRREADEYRLFSLYALGRVAEAETAAEILVGRDPLARLTDEQPPRIRAFYDGVRARLLPQLARTHYHAGRAALDSKDFAAAEEELSVAERLIRESEDTAVADSGLGDLQVLVEGFRVIAQSQRAAGATRVAASAPTAVNARYSSTDVDVQPPVVLDQAVPAVPPSLREQVIRARRAMVLNLTIDASGRVTDAVVIVSLNPVYDRMVLDASSRWRYRPATKSGVPVPYVKSLAIAVR